MKTNSHHLYKVWQKMPVDYYQVGTKSNFLQMIWHLLKISSAKKILRNYKFIRVLDVGCASGYMISQIAKEFPKAKYFGVDVYDQAILYGKSKYPEINFKTAFADNLPFKNNFFDAIIFYETIEHVEDPLKTLRELKRVLKKDGVLILAMDSGNWLFRVVWFFWENTKGRIWQDAHLHPFHHTELLEVVEKSGLKIEKKLFTHLGMEVTFVLRK
jgi:ubiquinone/menaquinone biosynthesis C-methylase UbiE